MQHLMDQDIIHHGEKEGTALASARGNWQTEIDCTFIYRLSNLKKSYSKLYGAFSQCVIRGQSSRMPNCCTVSAKTMAHFPSVQRWKSSCEDNGYTNSKSCCLSRAVILLFEQLTLNAMSAMSVMLTHTKLMRIGWGCNFTRSNTVYICSLKSFQYFSNIFEMLWSIWFVFFRLIADKNSILQLREEHGVAYQRSFPGCQLIDWLLQNAEAESRRRGLELCRTLQEHGIIQHGEECPHLPLWCMATALSLLLVAACSGWSAGTFKNLKQICSSTLCETSH